MNWKLGDRLTHGHNPGLGPGRIVAVEGRTLVVEFPRHGTRLRLAADAPALRPLDLRPGRRVRLASTGREERIEAVVDAGRVRLAGGREVPAEDVWPIDSGSDLVERLALGDLDTLEDFANRFD